MNVAEVRQLAAHLRQGADRLRAVVSTVDGRVNYSSWEGPQAQRFRQEFWPARRSQLLHAAEALRGLAQSASNNADEQERVSGGQVGGWQHSSGTYSSLISSTLLTLGVSGTGATLGEALRRLITDPTVRLSVERSLERVAGWQTSGNGSLAGVPAEYKLSAETYARVYGTTGLEFDSQRLAADAEAGAVIGARLQADGHLGNEHAGVGGHAYAEVEVGARIQGNVTVDGDGASASVGGDVGARVEVGADARGHLSGVEAGVEAKAYAGLTAHAEVTGEVSLDQVKAHVDVGAAIGIGGGLAFDVEVRPMEVASDTWELASKWTKGWKSPWQN
jgi:hypothetical protein